MTKFIIIGMGQFGRALAFSLVDAGYEVSVVDKRESVIKEVKERVSYAVTGDAADARVLRYLGVDADDACVILAVGEGFEHSILIAAQLKELGAKNLYVRCANELHDNVLRLIGINRRFRVEEVAATQLVSLFLNEGVMRLRKIDATHSIADVKLPQAWERKKLRDVDLRTRFHLNLLTLRRGSSSQMTRSEDDVMSQPELPVIGTPEPDLVFQKDDVLVLFGKESDLQSFVDQYNLQR